jgi:L-fuconolactonase
MLLQIDAHHHFIDTGRFSYYWMTEELAAIRGCFGPEDMRPLLSASDIDRSVLVQAIPSLEETEGLLATASITDFVAGVVGWVDLTAPNIADVLLHLRTVPGGRKLVGIRHQVHDEPDPGWLLRADVRRGLAAVQASGLAYDLLVRSRELPAALDLVRTFPDCRFVVDHIAKPNIKAHEIEPWATRMQQLIPYSNVWVKLSGMAEEADWANWSAADLKPYVDRLLDWFGPARLMFGSNWPFCLVAGSYARIHDALLEALGPLSATEHGLIFGGSAANAYGLDVEETA